MKKISVLIALAMALTIGGVYATWNYAQDGVAGVDVTPTVTLTEKVVDTAQGEITVDTSGIEIVIDDTNGDYVAEMSVSGQIDITFEASNGAAASIKENGLPMQFTISVSDPWEFKGTQIFTAKADPSPVNNGTAAFNATITAAEIQAALELGNISLPTVEDYDAFATALTQGEITITVGEIA